MSNTDIEHRKSELRMQIGRMRRRIDGRLRSAGRQGQRLISWREYVARHPGYSMLAAFGVGLAASSGLGRAGLPRDLALRLVRHIASRAGRRFWHEFSRIWEQSGAGP